MYVDPSAYQWTEQLEARASLHFFTKFMFKKRRGYRWLDNWHHKEICEALTRVFEGKCKRLVINIPPRYSKTEIAVVNFIAWALGHAPDSEFIHTSYSSTLALNNSSAARLLVEHPDYRRVFPEVQIRRDARSKGDWRTTAGGVIYAQGAGGTITGFGAGKLRDGFGGAIIIDDIHKADEARSDKVREGVIEWFNNTLESRTNSPDTPIIVIGQRLHERDLPGWLLGGGNGEEWEHVCLKAISDDGEALWTDKHDITTLRRMERSKPYEFAGQYQQQPSPRDGGMFARHWFPIVDAAPASSLRVRKWDLAGTIAGVGGDPDYTVGVLMSKTPDGFYYVEDVVRFQGSPHEVENAIMNTAQRDGTGVTVGLSQDPGQAGKFQVEHLIRKLAGFTVRSSPETGSKDVRAAPFSSQCEAGNVRLVKGQWTDDFIEELAMFPNATHDDQVDAAAGAFALLADGADMQQFVDFMTSRAALMRAQKGTTNG